MLDIAPLVVTRRLTVAVVSALSLASCGSSTAPDGDHGECRADEPAGVVHGLGLDAEGAVFGGRITAVAADVARIAADDGTTLGFRWLGTPLDEQFRVGDAVVVERRRELLDDFPPFEAAAVIDVLLGRDRRAVALQLEHAEHYAYADVTVALGEVDCCADCSDNPEAAVLSCQRHAVIARSGAVAVEIPLAETRALADWIVTPVEATSISAVPGPASPCVSDDTERVRMGVDMLGPAE